jgi:hypothetical protein
VADQPQTSAIDRVLSQDDAVDEAAAHGIYSGSGTSRLEQMSPALRAAYDKGPVPYSDTDR